MKDNLILSDLAIMCREIHHLCRQPLFRGQKGEGTVWGGVGGRGVAVRGSSRKGMDRAEIMCN